MQFDSLAAALAMNGHGGYVWSVYLIAALVVVFLLLGPVLRSRRIMLERLGQLRREQAAQNKEVPLASGS
ncbi:MAG: heme exporter protein CcmD [Gammaproteobacteria bacterium]|nr:heme exporter protein CcmD [Gammaproteobacteria bacterium]